MPEQPQSSNYGVDLRATRLVMLLAAAWGLFEWRVRSENKTFMRLSALGRRLWR